MGIGIGDRSMPVIYWIEIPALPVVLVGDGYLVLHATGV
jgi:hypothetical protein